MSVKLLSDRERIKKRCEELEVFYDVDNATEIELISIDNSLDAIQKYDEKYPENFMKEQIELIKDVRNEVWSYSQEFQFFYFDLLKEVFWNAKASNYNPLGCRRLAIKMIGDVERIHQIWSCKYED